MDVAKTNCVNCFLETPAQQKLCVHCGKPPSLKIPVRVLVTKANPTAQDLAGYAKWLALRGRNEVIQESSA